MTSIPVTYFTIECILIGSFLFLFLGILQVPLPRALKFVADVTLTQVHISY